MKNPARFVRLDKFVLDRMADKIAKNAHISPNIVKKYSDRAIGDWEQKTGQNLSSLLRMSSVDRSANLDNIVADLRHSLGDIVPSVKTLDKSMCIASVSLEIMFNRF